MNLIITINQKSIIDTHTQNKEKSKHNSKESHQIKREENKGKERKKKELKKKINKMTINTYVSVITLERVAWTYIHYRM